MGNEETKLMEKVNKMGMKVIESGMGMRVIESELDKKSLEPLGEFDVVIVGAGVFVMFKPQSLSLSEREYSALMKFGQDNASLLYDKSLTTWVNSYCAVAFYSNVGRAEGTEEKAYKMGKIEKESKLDKKSLEPLGEYDVSVDEVGVFVEFPSLLFNLRETEAKALVEFGQDNKFLLSGDFVVVLMHSYRICVFYPNRDYTKEQVEEIVAEGKGE